jgi:hypothetical protein
VDWSRPWFETVAATGRAVASREHARVALSAVASRAGLRNARGLALRFGPPHAAGDAAYEEHIARTGEVPTRDNLHDFFNALVWLTLPRTKARLNALQSQAIDASGIGARRGPLRDAATLIDENAVLLVTQRADLVAALRRHDWRTLFVEERAAWGRDVRVIVFGHALMEKLTAPYKGVTAHALPIPLSASASLAEVDSEVAATLDARLTPRQLLPLPVLGIPGWADSQEAAFYEDAAVFRPAPDRGGAVMRIAGG